jgi:F-box-like
MEPDLPYDVWLDILRMLDASSLTKVGSICTSWRAMANDEFERRCRQRNWIASDHDKEEEEEDDDGNFCKLYWRRVKSRIYCVNCGVRNETRSKRMHYVLTHIYLCARCYQNAPRYRLTNKGGASSNYALTNGELERLPSRVKRLGFGRQAIKFVEFQVRDFADKKWGGEHGVAQELHRRDARRSKLAESRANRQQQRRDLIVQALRARGVARFDWPGCDALMASLARRADGATNGALIEPLVGAYDKFCNFPTAEVCAHNAAIERRVRNDSQYRAFQAHNGAVQHEDFFPVLMREEARTPFIFRDACQRFAAQLVASGSSSSSSSGGGGIADAAVSSASLSDSMSDSELPEQLHLADDDDNDDDDAQEGDDQERVTDPVAYYARLLQAPPTLTAARIADYVERRRQFLLCNVDDDQKKKEKKKRKKKSKSRKRERVKDDDDDGNVSRKRRQRVIKDDDEDVGVVDEPSRKRERAAPKEADVAKKRQRTSEARGYSKRELFLIKLLGADPSDGIVQQHYLRRGIPLAENNNNDDNSNNNDDDQ